MRLPLVLLACAALGVIAGAWLIGTWAVGCAVIFDSLAVAAWAIWGYDDGQEPGEPQPQVHPVHALEQVLERARGAS